MYNLLRYYDFYNSQVEYVSGYGAVDAGRLLGLRDVLTPDWPEVLWQRLMSVGLKCTAPLKKDRPTMSDVSFILLPSVSYSRLVEGRERGKFPRAPRRLGQWRIQNLRQELGGMVAGDAMPSLQKFLYSNFMQK